MNRRSFLGLIGKIGVAAAIATHLPVEWVPTTPRRYAAIDFLVKAWREHMKGRSVRECPEVMEAGSDLWDAYEADVIANMHAMNNWMAGPFTDARYPRENLMFKAGRLVRSKESGWWVELGGKRVV
jgi:hypothetical protein